MPMRLATVGLFVLASTAGAWQSQVAPADTVLINGTVITVDARDSVAQALAVAGGKIVAVGTTTEIRRRIGPQTKVIDLNGRTATPGLIDTHVHFSEAADVLDLGVPSVRSMADVIAMVKAWADKLPPGQGVRGVGWDEGKLAERRYITAADLDKAAPDRPVYLTHTTGHYGVANSLAMKMAGITKDTKDPPAGTIDRDKDGNPTGVFKEAATGMVSRVVGNSGPRESQEAQVLRIIAGFNREGMTGAKDLNINRGKWDLYKKLLEEGKLTVRVAALWAGGRTVQSATNAIQQMAELPKAPQSLGDGRLVLEGLKLYIDGSGGARTAWMYDDWNKDWTGVDTGNPGYPTTPTDVYAQQVRVITEAGWSVGTHAIGDRGIDVVVDAYKAALEATGKKGLRHSIIHSNTPSDHAIEVMAYLQKTFDAGYPELQAPFMWWIGDTYAGNLGPKRAPRLEPLATMVKKGVMFAGGSDYSVTPYAGRYGLWASVARKTLNATYGATPFGTAESIDVHTALKSYTIWAAHQLYLEKQVGSLEVGKDADIAVWDKNMYAIPTDALKDLKCELTLLAGKTVFEK